MKNEKRVPLAFENCDRCIVFSTDASFIPMTSVAIQSIIENSSKDNCYDIIVLHNSITPFVQGIVCHMADGHSNISIRFVDVTEMIGNDSLYVGNRATLSQETYYRLYIPWILDNKYSKSLYIDGDMILRDDIVKVFKEDLGHNLIAGVRDYWGICNCYMPDDPRRSYRESIGLTDIDGYIIGATILFNLPEFRKRITLDEVKACINKREWEQHDQDVINVLCKGSIHYLSPTWGWMSDYGNNHYLPMNLQEDLRAVAHSPAIVHFGGIRKPYYKPYGDFDEDFWKYAEKSPYFSAMLSMVRSNEYKAYIVYYLLKHDFDTYYTADGIQRFYKGVDFGKIQAGHTRYRVIEIQGNMLHLEGMVGFFGVDLNSKISVFIKVNNDIIPVTKQTVENGYIKHKHRFTYRGESFEFDFKLDPNVDNYELTIVTAFNEMVVEKTNIGFEKYAPLGRNYKNCYYHSGDWVVQSDLNRLQILKADAKLIRQKEKAFCKEMLATGQIAEKKAVFVRRIARLFKKFTKKPIWLISDRISRADDNGEAFFRFLRNEKKKEVSAYFVIDKNCPDYRRLKKYGHVVPSYSYRHKMIHLLASFSVSSQTDEIYRNPFRAVLPDYRDMISDVKFVFLQHGIISNDLSDWLCRRRQHLTGFVTSTPKEYESVVNGKYDYTKEIWLTGLPRFDLLEDKHEKSITILPTWRMYLATYQDHTTGTWNLCKNFSQTTYARFYRDLLHHPKLRAKAKELGYRIQFKIHPSFLAHESEFGFDQDVNLIGIDTSYREIYSKSSLIVTDYSSAIYDFIYLRKPIIYAQFDADEFFSGRHIYTKGYFDYERDGFGEVEHDLEGTVNRIIEYMENDCQLKPKYRERIDQFFAFNDKNNCQRVYERIRELEKDTH